MAVGIGGGVTSTYYLLRDHDLLPSHTESNTHDHDHKREHDHDHDHEIEDDVDHDHDHEIEDAIDHDPDHEVDDAIHHEHEREISPQAAATIGLKTQKVDFGPVEDVIELLGTVATVPDLRHVIASRTSGQVLHIHVQVGQAVCKGDILIEIDSAELARNIFEARRMEADYQKLLVDFTRTKGHIQQLELEKTTSEESAQLAEA
ncbi:MAG: biotin/lipoyl-binding protein, partial [Phycisphaerales bacterium]